MEEQDASFPLSLSERLPLTERLEPGRAVQSPGAGDALERTGAPTLREAVCKAEIGARYPSTGSPDMSATPRRRPTRARPCPRRRSETRHSHPRTLSCSCLSQASRYAITKCGCVIHSGKRKSVRVACRPSTARGARRPSSACFRQHRLSSRRHRGAKRGVPCVSSAPGAGKLAVRTGGEHEVQ